MRKGLYLLLVCAVLLLLFSTGAFAAEDETYPIPTGTTVEKLNTLKGIFKEGLYWNHWPEDELGECEQWNVTVGGFTTTLSTKPCPYHKEVLDSCNHYWGKRGGSQCCGYARMIYHLVWNADPSITAYALRYIPSNDDASLLDHVKVGDIVWDGGHFFVVTAINGNTFSGTDCNGKWVCNIKWSRTWKKTDIEGKMRKKGKGAIFSPVQTIIDDSSCNWQTYQIVYSKGQSVRRQPHKGTNAVKTAAKGDIVYVDMNRIVDLGTDGTWGYARTGDGKYGWMRIDLESYCVKVDVSDITTVDTVPRIAVSTKAASGTDQCYVKVAPYEAENTVRVEAKNSIIYLSGCVKNKYGNIWYLTEDGYYIWSGDLEIMKLCPNTIMRQINKPPAKKYRRLVC